MKVVFRSLILCGLFSAILPVGCKRAEPTLEKESPNLPRLRDLDFAPFAKALTSIRKRRLVAVNRLVRGGDIDSVGAAMAEGKVNSEELTLYFLDRIRRNDETLRSYLELNPAALEEARAADRERTAGKVRGKLHGIPVNLKDNIATVAPLHTTAGAEVLLDHSPAAEAAVVKKLRDAGAVILGKASLSELAGTITTEPPGYNAISGMGVNPYRADLPVSGSSSGSAISTSAFLTMASVGTETSGSLIAPGASNGVVAMMPGPGVVSGEGIVPLIRFQDSAGPIARSVRDAALLLAVMDEAETDYVAALDRAALKGVAAGVLRKGILANKEEDGTDFWLVRIGDGLKKAGASPRDLDETFADKPSLLPVIFLGLSIDTVGYLTAAGAPVKSLADLHRYHLADPARRIPQGQNMVDFALRVLPELVSEGGPAATTLYEEAARFTRTGASDRLAATFAAGEVELLVSLANTHSDVYATAGYPAITVPLGLDGAGAPNGVTFIGKPGEETRLLSFAYAFEQATGYRRAPSDRAE